MRFSRSRIRLWLWILFVVLVPFLVLSPGIHVVIPNETVYSILFFALLILRAMVIFWFIKLLIKWFHKTYIAQKPADAKAGKKANRALLGTSLLILFLLLEIAFMFIPQTQDVYKLGLANKVWNAYYREAENEKRFRDKPLKGRLDTQKEVIFFLGDSYTHGIGIKHNEERFPDMVYAQMDSSKFEAFNLGRGNTDTRDEYVRLVNFGLKPDYLVLQYYHNDIEKVGAKYGHFNISKTGYKNKKPSVIKKAAVFLGLLPLESSFFLNFTALNSSRFFMPKTQNDYKDCLTKAYSDTSCVNEHLKDIQSIINYASVNHIKLYVLFIPDARDIEYTQSLFDAYIIPYLRKHHIRYISLDQSFKPYKASELIINPLNAHTNPFANSIIAKQILDSIPELKH